jgi:hypothetical protein
VTIEAAALAPHTGLLFEMQVKIEGGLAGRPLMR